MPTALTEIMPMERRGGNRHFFSLQAAWLLQIPLPKWIKPCNNAIINSKVTLDQAGRIVLPKSLRDELQLSPGDTLDLTIQGEEVTLRPRRSSTPAETA